METSRRQLAEKAKEQRVRGRARDRNLGVTIEKLRLTQPVIIKMFTFTQSFLYKIFEPPR